MSAPLLDVRNLVVTFPTRRSEVTVVDRLSFSLESGEIAGIVGESGAGKSTAVLAMLGLVRHGGRIAGGEVLFDGRDLLSLPREELRHVRGSQIAMITQNPRQSLHPMLKIGRQISTAYRSHNQATRPEGMRKAVSMLEMVGINDAERRVTAFPHELSGGMAQRTLIAMALSSGPRLLVADEPTSGLDVTIQAQVLDEMWDTVQETGSAVLIVTQDLGIIANYCDRVLVVEKGRNIEDAPTRKFFRAPEQDYSRRILSLQRQEKLPEPEESHGSEQPLISVQGLGKEYILEGGEVLTAVSGADFEIYRGRTLGVVGESGSGKTTVGMTLLRLTEPTTGGVLVDAEPIGEIPLSAFRNYRSRLQVVFQDPFDALNPRWSVHRLLREPLDLHTKLTAADKRERIGEIMDMIGLPRTLGAVTTRQLSAGQQQRVSIGRALITDPDFVVLDEPTSALPPAARAEIIALLAELQRKLGIAYLYISHDLTTVEYLCHDVAVMYLSQIVEHGTRSQVFEDPQHPYSRALLASHLFQDPDQRRIDREIRETLTGEIPSPVDLPTGCYLASRCPEAVPECRERPQTLETLPDGRKIRCWRITEGDLVW